MAHEYKRKVFCSSVSEEIHLLLMTGGAVVCCCLIVLRQMRLNNGLDSGWIRSTSDAVFYNVMARLTVVSSLDDMIEAWEDATLVSLCSR